MKEPNLSALAGVQLLRDGVDVKMSRHAIRARLFGGDPEPTRLGRFLVVERVGSGGMGIVYAAYDPQLDRRVALKVLRNDVVRTRRAQRQQKLLEEARAMARLSHANVVTVYEVGTVDDQVFVAMEYIEGPTFRAWVVAQKPTPKEILEVLMDAGHGLVAAHEAGLVHRDFKPENILVASAGPVQVTDFGLAVATEVPESSSASSSAHRMLTPAGTLLTREFAGTPAYMAPEQLKRGNVDARADQYGFCVTLYEVLVGTRPRADAELQRMLVEPDYEPPSIAVPESASVARTVMGAIERGLATNPQDRFGDMRALLAAIAPRAKSRRPLFALGAIGLGAVGVVAALADEEPPCPSRQDRLVGIWDTPTRRAAEDAFGSGGYAEDAFGRAAAVLDQRAQAWLAMHQAACLASHRGEQSDERLDRRMRCLDDRLAQLEAAGLVLAAADSEVVRNAMRVVSGVESVRACEDPSDRQLAGIGILEEADPNIASSMRTSDALRRAGRFDDALAAAAKAVDLSRDKERADAEAQAQLALGRSALALASFQPATAAFESARDLGATTEQYRVVAAAAIGQAEVAGIGRAEHERGLLLAEAAGIAVASAGRPVELVADLELLRARLLYAAGRLDEGLEHAEEGLSVLEASGDDANARLADALQVQAMLLYAKGRLEEAHTFCNRALALRREVFGDEHPAVAESLATLGALALVQRKPETAMALFQQALQVRTAALGDGHPDTAKTLANLASARQLSGDLQGARDGYVDALARFENVLGPDDPRLAYVSANVGAIEYDLGHVEQAIEAYVAAVGLMRESLGPDHPKLSITLANLGRAELEVGDAAAGREFLAEALSIRKRTLGEEHDDTAHACISLAAAEILLGDTDAARSVLDEANTSDPKLAAEIELWRGHAWLHDREFRRANAHLETALAALRGEDEDPQLVASAAFLLAHGLLGAGEAERARELATEVKEVVSAARPPAGLREFCGSTCADELAKLL